MVLKLTHTGVVEIQPLQPPPAGNPFLIRMHALPLSAHRSESLCQAPNNFFEAVSAAQIPFF